MKGFVKDIESLTVTNDHFRQVLYTAKHCQLVVMALQPAEEIGAEVHQLDQFFRVEAGSGVAVLDGTRTTLSAGFAALVPAGARHNIINTGTVPLKLYTIYSPPNHRDGVMHHTRADAEADHEQFDGKTTESSGSAPNRKRAVRLAKTTPLKNPSQQKSGRTLQGRDATPGIKGNRPVKTPRIDAKQSKGIESRKGGGR
jgi:mannose-6-phosphate isomerase-like protein (cupin superfamily)